MAVLAAAAVALGVLGVVVAVVVVVAGALRFLAALLRTGVDGLVLSLPPARPRVAGSRERSFLL